ncbi:MAG: hypothetical protein K8T91_18775 [Planctomycetes bacterium]|nr:hypothetical protein [Planctomycetota bacterium]
MRRIGFSTGALAKGDFQKGIKLQEGRVDALELSALREDELAPLLHALAKLDLSKFAYVSFHAPSQREHYSEKELVKLLTKVATYISSIIIHPDIIENPDTWKPIEGSLVLENMDQRKPIGRTVEELKWYFEALPKARFCFDIGHARQVDPTLGVATEMLRVLADRMVEVHISEVDAASKHVGISTAAMKSYARISSLIPKDVPAIIESVINPEAIDDELRMARASLGEYSVVKRTNGEDTLSAMK